MPENSRFGREPCQVVEIGQDFCALTYGTAPCTAGGRQNFLKWSEDLTNGGGPAYWSTFNISGIAAGDMVAGVQLQSFTTTASAPTSGEIQVSRFNFGTVAGRPAYSFTFYIKKAVGNIAVVVGTFLESGASYLDEVVFDSSDGSVVAEDPDPDTVFLSYDSVEVETDYLRVKVSINLDPALIENRQYQLSIIPEDPATYQTGGYQVTVGTEYPEYLKTEDEAAEFAPSAQGRCFNTRATCQDPDNYDRETLPLRFVNPQGNIPTDEYYIPSLVGVSVTPARLNPGGANKSANALGERATVSLSFLDHPHDDRVVDKYRAERDYNPLDRGTFWSKWRARNPYYMQRSITLRSGYVVDGELVDDIARSFVITGFTGPGPNGQVTITGKDPLTFAEDSKAQAPIVSTGKLAADVSAGAGSATLDPAGVGDAEYPSSGFVRVEKEVWAFTRSGDTLTITAGGQFGTEEADHDEGSTVQLCLRYTAEPPQDIAYDLLANYAGIPTSYIDKAQWDAEALDYLPRLYSAIITEPEGVSKLIGEMCQQMYFYIWFDERVGLIKLRAVRLAEDDTVTDLDESANLIADSVRWRDLPEQLVTQVWVYYGQINPTEKLDQADNYAAVEATVNLDSESADRNNLRRIKKVFSRWIDATNASAAVDLGQRILNRYTNAPRECTFRLDAKDRELWLGDYLQLTHRNRVGFTGLPEPVNLQVFQAQESVPGDQFQYTAQEFIPIEQGSTGGDPNVREIPITTDFLNVNLRDFHDALFGAPTGTEKVTFILRSGVTIGGYAAGGGVNVPYAQRDTSNDTYPGGNFTVLGGVAVIPLGDLPILQRRGIGSLRVTAAGAEYAGSGREAGYEIREYPVSVALDTGTWPGGVELNLVIEGGAFIVGEGGNGSAHADDFGSASLVPGGDGGDALYIRRAISITNGGTIAGGGGGGTADHSSVTPLDPVRPGNPNPGDAFVLVAGGGGAGLEISDVKNLVYGGITAGTITATSEPAVGNRSTGGSGAVFDWRDDDPPVSSPRERFRFEAGRGGNLAQPGGANRTRNWENDVLNTDSSLDLGGQAGQAIQSGASLITWINKGDVRGDEN